MSTIITSIDPDSPAMRAGLRAGQQLLTINGHAVVDVLDYRFYGYDQRFPHRSASGSLRRSEQESVMEVGSSKIADWSQMTTITFMLT